LESTNPYTTAISTIQQNTTAATPVNLAIKVIIIHHFANIFLIIVGLVTHGARPIQVCKIAQKMEQGSEKKTLEQQYAPSPTPAEKIPLFRR
jgi:hypothetical protein